MMFVLGATVTPGAGIRWYDIVLAPLVMPFMIGQFIAIIITKNNQAIAAQKTSEKSSE
jgi:Sec-independent protein secretion pathway component TatC